MLFVENTASRKYNSYNMANSSRASPGTGGGGGGGAKGPRQPLAGLNCYRPIAAPAPGYAGPAFHGYRQHISYQQPSFGRVRSPANTTSSSSSNSQSGAGGNGAVHGSGGAEHQLSKTNLYIRGLAQNTSDKDLVAMCSQYGNIISTKAILDKNTNKCKGYGFVDFESAIAAETAVAGLQGKGVQAQMAKAGIATLRRADCTEQDPTNLYMANLPAGFKEHDVDALLAKYGQVVSTRILRDLQGVSKGVGFARMESRDKCEQIIALLNGSCLPGAKEPLLVKFADGGAKKRLYRSLPDPSRGGGGGGGGGGGWRDLGDNGGGVYDGGVQAAVPGGIVQFGRPYGSVGPAYGMATQWMPQYLVQPPPHHLEMMPAGNDPNGAVQYGSMIPQLTNHMSAMQLASQGSYMSPHGYGSHGYYPGPLIHAVAIDDAQSNTASPEDSYQSYQPK